MKHDTDLHTQCIRYRIQMLRNSSRVFGSYLILGGEKSVYRIS